MSANNHIKSVIVDINGIRTFDRPGHVNLNTLLWPGRGVTNTARVLFQDDGGNFNVITESGPWAWFKLLDKAHIKSTNDAKRYLLSFQTANRVANYELVAQNLINPFTPGIVEGFYCPEIL